MKYIITPDSGEFILGVSVQGGEIFKSDKIWSVSK